MSQFEFRFVSVLFGAKLIDVLLAVLLLSSVSSRSIETKVQKITEELPGDETNIRPLALENRRDSVVNEFFEIVRKLSEESISSSDVMQADQPSASSETGKNDTRNKKELNALRAWREQMELNAIKQKVLESVDRQEGRSTYGPVPSFPPDFDLTKELPILPGFGDGSKLTALSPLCPIKNEENLTLLFNINEPKASSKDMILSVVNVELKLLKIPFKFDAASKYEDDTAASKWRETFEKSGVNASDRVIDTKVEEQERMITISVYKIRNKNKTNDLKKLDTRLVAASFEGITSWNITKAVNVWGNEAKRTLNLVVTVEDDSGKKIPARNVFKMRCGPHLERPVPLDMLVRISETSQTSWIKLTTEELLAKAEAYNGAASTVNRFAHNHDRTGALSNK